MRPYSFCVWFLVLLMAFPAAAQNVPAPAPREPSVSDQALALQPGYILGPGDVIQLRAFDIEELNDKTFRIDANGEIMLPMIGTVTATGMTIEKMETEIRNRLKTFIRNPQVVVLVVQFRSEPVFLTGAFKNPGIYGLKGRKTVFQILTEVGGLQPNANRRVRLTRRLEYGVLPLPSAVTDSANKLCYVDISIGSKGANPADDIELKPYDLLTAERADKVYVNGAVGNVGAFELNERDNMTIVEVLSLAGGLKSEADSEHAVVLRPVLSTARRAEIPVNLKRILAGRDNDFPMSANDVLFVPSSSRRALTRSVVLPLTLSVITAAILFTVRR